MNTMFCNRLHTDSRTTIVAILGDAMFIRWMNISYFVYKTTICTYIYKFPIFIDAAKHTNDVCMLFNLRICVLNHVYVQYVHLCLASWDCWTLRERLTSMCNFMSIINTCSYLQLKESLLTKSFVVDEKLKISLRRVGFDELTKLAVCSTDDCIVIFIRFLIFVQFCSA